MSCIDHIQRQQKHFQFSYCPKAVTTKQTKQFIMTEREQFRWCLSGEQFVVELQLKEKGKIQIRAKS